MRKFLSLMLALLTLFALCPAQAERWEEIPEVLRFTQTTNPRDYVKKDLLYVQSTYPTTTNETVNREMAAVIDGLEAEGRNHLPQGPYNASRPTYLDVGAYISRTGDRWMSFLSIARIAHNMEQTYVDFDARVYDMTTGARLTLSDLLGDQEAAWALLETEVREQLSAYYWTLEPDAEALAALCAREAIENTPFTLTAGKLSLHYRTDALYPGKNNLMHVNIYYSALGPLLPAQGREITDNSHYKMIALTYDDGGGRVTSLNVLNELRLHGAGATFFIVGTQMASNHDVMDRQQDAGFAMASHNYEHDEHISDLSKIPVWKEKFDREMDSIVGVRPAYMRAPGGNNDSFIRAQVGLPLIRWSGNTTDAGNSNVANIASRAINNARDGAIILMHDINKYAYQYAQIILPELERRGFLCVTVDELFDHYGVVLLPNTVYHSAEEAAAQQP